MSARLNVVAPAVRHSPLHITPDTLIYIITSTTTTMTTDSKPRDPRQGVRMDAEGEYHQPEGRRSLSITVDHLP